MPFIKTNDGAQIHYQWDGQLDAPVLMLSNSLGTDLSMWDPQIPALLEHFRVLRYDARGHGASELSPGPYTMDLLGQDALALLDQLNVQQAHFCGLSMGGMVGMWLASRYPDRIGRLALCNTSAKIGTVESWNDRIGKVEKGGMAAITPAVLERWFSPRAHRDAPETIERIRKLLLATPGAGYNACCAALRDMDQRDALQNITAPTLVITGTHDLASPVSDGKLLAQRIPGAEYIELDAAHLSNQELPEAFTMHLVKFLVK